MKNTAPILPLLALLILTNHSQAADPQRSFDSMQELVPASGVTGGLVVHLADGNGDATADLFSNDHFVVHGLYRNRDAVGPARQQIKQKKLYGKVSVQHWDHSHLPYTDNLVNLLVAEGLGDVPVTEVLRVLAPNGTAFVKSGGTWQKTVKAWPAEIDEWTHYLHGPDNNAVAQDDVVGVPRHVQWVGDPKFARGHEQLASVSAMVSSGGRLFSVVDMGVTADIRMPARWQLVARDAFNGLVLWTRNIEQWHSHLHSFRSGPADLPFRLVAVGSQVYMSTGDDKPVLALDAATGKELITYDGTEQTRQIIRVDDKLIMLAGTSQVEVRRNGPDTARRTIVTANAETGDILWRQRVSANTLIPLVVSGQKVMYQTDKHLACLALDTGDEVWKVDHPVNLGKNKKTISWASPTLTAQNDIAYVADFRKLSAVSVTDGRILWTCSAREGFSSPPDIFVINGLMWRGYTGQRGGTDFGEGLNAITGELEKTLETSKAWEYPTLAHARCYRPKATNRFILASRSGVEFINVDSGKVNLNHWVRGTCQYGIMPCNGLLYAPPHSCACNIKSMFRGMSALAPASPNRSGTPENDVRLEQGPAFGKVAALGAAAASADDWPVFRHDNERSGSTSTKVPRELKQSWQAKIGGRLSSPVAGGGRVYVADIDAHTIHALDAADGKPVWQYTAGGRIDSPPTVYNGKLFFGSADGWVYCVREKDGVLVWRFRGAPQERRIMVRGQLESAWPIHGSVLIEDGTLVVSAGRSSYLDGGIHVHRLDPATGSQASETIIDSLEESGDQPAGGVDLRGVLNDVLSVSEGNVYMRHLKIDFDTGDDLAIGPPHLFAPTGYLDDNWWHRTYWLFGSDAVCMPPVNESGWQIWPRVGNMLPSGRILSLGKHTVFGYGRDKYPDGHSGQRRGGEQYRLFAAEKLGETLPSNKDEQHLRSFNSGRRRGLEVTERDRKGGGESLNIHLWSQTTPIFVRSLVLADDTLFLAGPPESDDLRGNELTLLDGNKSEAVFLGKAGASLCVVEAEKGRQLAQHELPAAPVFDGMIAAQRQLFLSLQDGSLLCFGE
ncbi:MAG: PQQ-binding-like beta-propeller repeat protein [Fuerstiella sp.]|nr:PQQ-binding-like beta-propeller repeat protein [Fuerstiella sp.]